MLLAPLCVDDLDPFAHTIVPMLESLFAGADSGPPRPKPCARQRGPRPGTALRPYWAHPSHLCPDPDPGIESSKHSTEYLSTTKLTSGACFEQTSFSPQRIAEQEFRIQKVGSWKPWKKSKEAQSSLRASRRTNGLPSMTYLFHQSVDHPVRASAVP